MENTINGLQTGRVLHLEKDPQGESRILVNIPAINKKKSEGVWVRLASADAGNNRGFFFPPEIGDEVILGFINGDPASPVMLGMLWSKTEKPPIIIKDTNHEKGITTRSKMHIHFNDETKSITIDTPAGNRIQLDEQGKKIEIKDQNNNRITMNGSGIKIESPTNIEIKAGINLTLTAGSSLKLGASSVSVKADANLNLESSGGAKLSSAATVDIKGALVRIN
jgi:uncharacterized protein involved in type VI secretion and phage assembly